MSYFLLVLMTLIHARQKKITATVEEQENKNHHIEHDTNTNDTKREVESNSIHCKTDDNNESRYNTKSILLLTCNDEIDEYNTCNESTILDDEKGIDQRLTNAENNADVENVDIYKTINRHSNENNNVLILTYKHEINTCIYYKDNNKQNKETYSEQSIE